MIKIEKIEWMSKEAEEAILYLTDGNFNIICFSCPFKLDEFNKGEYDINCGASDLYRLKDEAYHIGKLPHIDFFAFRVYGKVVDRKIGIVKVGDFEFYLSENSFPGDIVNNDFVTFETDRFDLF